MNKPLRISWSALRAHEECHQKSHLIRDGKRAKVTNIRNFWPGTVVDIFMRHWLDDPFTREAEIADSITAIMDENEKIEKDRGNIVRYRDAADRDVVRGFCLELATRLVPILDEHVLPYEHDNGKWFKVPLTVPGLDGAPRDVLLTGEMDLLVNNAGPIVWDLKGTADDQYWRKVVGQLTFYDLAIWASSGVKTRHVGLIQPMCKERILTFDVTDQQRRDLLIRIERYAHDIWSGEKACTEDTSKCHWCDVKHACTRFAQPGDMFGELAVGLRAEAEKS